MDTRSKVVNGPFAAASATAPIDGPSSLDDQRLANAARDELALIALPRANVLVAGRDAAVQDLLGTLVGSAQHPIAEWFPGQPLVLPQAERGGTVVLHDVGCLSLQQQIHVLEWLGRVMGRLQVISTTPVALLPRIRAGAFIDTLYYRLNTVYMDLTDLVEAA